MDAGFSAPLDGARLKIAQVVAGPVAKESDQKGTIACQAARIEIRAIVQLLNGVEDSSTGIRPYARFIVDDSRHRFGRHLG